MTILVADDDALVRQLLSHFLTKAGYEVIECRDGAETLRKVAETRADLLVLDYEMPDMNGAEVCERIREVPDAVQMPIILLTAHGGGEHEVESLGAGANDFVTKPVNLPVLKARIEAHAGLHALRRKLEEQNDELEKWRRDHELDLEAARLTQQAIVPQRPPVVAGWEFAARFRPLIQVGGDMYDWPRLPDGAVLLWMADATGHGVSAALFTMVAKLLFRHGAGEFSSPAQIMDYVNREFFGIFKGKSFMTVACVALRADTGKIVFSGAGHPPLLIVREEGGVESIPSLAPPLGLDANSELGETGCELGKRDALLLYTDGLYGASNPEGGRLGQADMVELTPAPERSAENFLVRILNAIAARSGGNASSDDSAVIAALRTG